ncbi:fructoselysine-6-P-deglycase FrlB-like protein [Actinopolyspora biskrensis]|uniref:Glutamine--fructose-6-phosphate aminotransferase [isomerizing] n=1 Tax=Actinopolyspora biskrensis TaxID=1470178 RepID=A0A852Z487_9ACTN|nr:sugar isomerase [Actinopolyspora biskrensis]NYH77073.1 fructoselysine-6-P-deglycase FrlB-like protein [Actinopolyspora biskrensis]
MAESFVQAEIATQPECWRQAERIAATAAEGLPEAGERVAVLGCGTSWFMAQSYAALRELSGAGVTDAFAASEFPRTRDYDRVVAITRSGTTTEVLRVLGDLDGHVATAVLTGVPDAVAGGAGHVVDLSFCDERSVVQTRFATTALALLRAHNGEDLTGVVEQAEQLLAETPESALLDAEQISFLGRGWTVGLAHEAALKIREAANGWTESYPALEYRHGPISIAEHGRATWMFGAAPDGLADEVRATGAAFVPTSADPMVELVAAQRLAVALAFRRGLDPDRPRHLNRSVVLETT